MLMLPAVRFTPFAKEREGEGTHRYGSASESQKPAPTAYLAAAFSTTVLRSSLAMMR